MCWSFEISLITAIFSYTIALYLWFRNFQNDKWNAALLFVVSSIQFWEALIWSKNGNPSNLVAFAIIVGIPLTLASEPLISLFGSELVGIKPDFADKIIYIAFFIILFILLVSSNSYPNVIRNGSIQYHKNDSSPICYWIFFAFLVYPFLKYGEPKKFYIIMSLFVGFLLFISFFKPSVGSYWCLYGNLIAIILLFYPY